MRLADFVLPHNAGDFSWQQREPTRYIAMRLPCGHFANLPVDREGQSRGHWNWDGNEDAPTITPSILCSPSQCNWHGYMTAGELRKI